MHVRLCFGAAGLVALALAGCSETADQRAAADPKTKSPTEIGKLIESLPNHARFSLSGVAFYGGRLYVATNIGLIEVEGTTLKSLHTWYSNDDVVEGPWVDETSKSLWIHRVHDGSLLRLDETGWHLVALPAPPKGYYSRGDMSEGFRGMSDTSGFRLVGGGGYVWGWSPPDHWILETAPSAPEFSALVGVGFFRGREIRVMRLEFCPPRSCNYAFYRRDGHGWSGGRDLPVGQVRQVLGTADGIFARSDTGELVRFDDNGAVVLETPGKCEAIARTSADKLMASFVGAGVFTLTQDGWTKVLDYPHGSSEGEHFALLAEENGVVAYATSSKPRLVGSASRAKWEYSGSTALWVSEGGKWVRIDAEKAVRP